MIVRLPAALLTLAFLAAISDSSFGQTFWQAGTGDWFTAANWTLGVPNAASPTAFDAVINNGGMAQIQGPGGSVRRLRLGSSIGNGRLLVDGGTLNVTDDLHLGEAVTGGGSMTVQGGATVNAVDTVVQYSSDDHSGFQITGAGTVYNATTSFIVGRAGNGLATLSVDGGAVLTSGTSSISSNGGFGTATVDGAGSRWSTTGAFTVGNVSAGTLNIQNQGTVHVGTALSISGTSNVNLNGGTLRFNTVSGLNRLNYTAGTIQLAGTRTVGADSVISTLYGATPTIPVNKGLTIEGNANVRVNTNVNGGTLTVANSLSFGNIVGVGMRTLAISNGGGVLSNSFEIGSPANEEGTVTISGAGTTLVSNSYLQVAGAGDGILQINSGGKAESTTGFVASSFGAVGNVSIGGVDAAWNVGGRLDLGGFEDMEGSGGAATVTVDEGGTLYVGGLLKIWFNDTLNLSGGTVRFDTLSQEPTSAFNFQSGTIQLSGNRTIGADGTIVGLFGAIPLVPSGKGLTVEGGATLSKPLTIAGGVFKTTSLAIGAGGSLNFDRGVLELTGGNVTGLVNLVIPANGEFRASGAATTRITAAAGSTITATGDLTLGNAALPNGFYGNGDLAVGANIVTLLDANDAVLDSAALVTLGAGGSPGALAAANGLTLDFGGNVIGYGTIDTPNDSTKPLINNGHIAGNSAAEPMTLSGYVKGVGTLDNVDVTGTLAPGFSPATVTLGSVAYAGQLEIELGGTALGSFDRLEHTLGAGIAQLGGSLVVSLIDGFVPALGNTFEFLTAAGGVNGTFAAETLPSLAGGLGWNVNYAANSVVLEVTAAPSFTADFDEDGDVDSADLTRWRTGFGAGATHGQGDADGDGDADGADFLAWQRQLGGTPSLPSTASVPEPSTLTLALLLAAFVLAPRSPRGRRELEELGSSSPLPGGEKGARSWRG